MLNDVKLTFFQLRVHFKSQKYADTFIKNFLYNFIAILYGLFSSLYYVSNQATFFFTLNANSVFFYIFLYIL